MWGLCLCTHSVSLTSQGLEEQMTLSMLIYPLSFPQQICMFPKLLFIQRWLLYANQFTLGILLHGVHNPQARPAVLDAVSATPLGSLDGLGHPSPRFWGVDGHDNRPRPTGPEPPRCSKVGLSVDPPRLLQGSV